MDRLCPARSNIHLEANQAVRSNQHLIFLFLLCFLYLTCEKKKGTETGVTFENGQMVFHARAGDLKRGLENKLTKGKKPEDMLVVRLEGKMYNPPKIIAFTAKAKANWKTLKNAVSSYYSANLKGDLEWMVSNFVPEEQPVIKSFLQREGIIKKNMEMTKEIKRVRILGQAKYKKYTIVFLQEEYKSGENEKFPAVFVQTNEGWKATNALAEDDAFGVIFAAVRLGEFVLPH